MVDRAKKFSELAVTTALSNTDLIPVVANTTGTKVSKTITYGSLTSLILSSSIPATNTYILFGANSTVSGSANLIFSSNALKVGNSTVFTSISANSITLPVDGALKMSNGYAGSNGQLLASNGTSSYWVTVTGYSLPTSNTTTLGGVKIDGTTITIANGVISAGGNAAFTSGNTTINGTLNVNGVFTATAANVVLGTAAQGNAVIKFSGAISSNVGPDTPNNYFLGNTSHPWRTLWVSTIRTANISYVDTDIVLQMGSNTASYLQTVLQNLSAAANASTNYNVSADTANATSNYGEYGINSSTFSGAGRFNDPLAVYLAAATSNLAVGTYGNYPVNIVVNSNTNWTFGTDSSLTLPNGPVIFTGNASTRVGVNTQIGYTGSNGSIYLSTTGKIYLKVSNTGIANSDWQRVTTTSVD
jgi:hypothetical protein